MKFRKLSLILGLLTPLAMCVSAVPASVSADENDPIFADDFESETISGWGVLGGIGELSVSQATSQSGNSCLRIEGRQQPFNGPSITLDHYIENLETYRFTGWVYSESDEEAVINCTLRFSDSVNVDTYAGLATIVAEPKTWTYFEGVIETPEDLSSTLLYFESQNTDLNFCIDDIRIYGKSPEAADAGGQGENTETVDKYFFDFENGFDEWISRGDTRLIRTDEQHYNGNYSMLSTNRLKVWNGPAVSVDGIQRETEYTYEAHVLYTDKKADDSHEFLLQLQYSYNGNETYAFISSVEAQKNVWTKVSGVYTVPEGATNVTLYLQTQNLEEGVPAEAATPTDLVSFYVDDISAIRSDLVGKSDFSLSGLLSDSKVSTILIIAGAALLLFVIIALIVRSASSGRSDENGSAENAEGVNDVLDVLDGKIPAAAAEAENKESKSEKKAEEPAKEEKKAADEKPSQSSGKNKKSKSSENQEKKSESAEKKPAEEKNTEAKKSEEKKSDSSSDKSEERKDDIFGIETFSYEDPDAATAASVEGSSETDSPFDGF